MKLSWGFVFMLFYDSAFFCVWTGLPPLPLYDFISLSSFAVGNYNQEEVDVINLPRSKIR